MAASTITQTNEPAQTTAERRRLQELSDRLPELSPVDSLFLELLWQIQADVAEIRRGRR